MASTGRTVNRAGAESGRDSMVAARLRLARSNPAYLRHADLERVKGIEPSS